jgi:hypothetical protein
VVKLAVAKLHSSVSASPGFDSRPMHYILLSFLFFVSSLSFFFLLPPTHKDLARTIGDRSLCLSWIHGFAFQQHTDRLRDGEIWLCCRRTKVLERSTAHE